MNGRLEAEQMAAEHEAKQPVAWAALRDDGDIAWIGYTPDGAADGACGRQIAPLYRQPQPTLTDAEREALRGVLDDPDLVLGDCRKPLEDLLARSTTSTR